jgi:hypothetical protein
MNVFNIDDAPNIFKHNIASSIFKSYNTNVHDENIEIPINIYIINWNNNLVDCFIIL